MGVEHGLGEVADPSDGQSPELVVDVANVCHERTLDGHPDRVRWERVVKVLDAWQRWDQGFDQPVVRLVADASLRGALEPADRRALQAAERDGYAEIVDYADPVILDLAEEHDCVVLTNDQFVAFRRDRPWLDGNDDCFVQYRGTAGEVELTPVVLSERSDYSVSRAEEQDELKDRRIDSRRQRGTHLLESVYRCDNPDCLRRAYAPEGAWAPPALGSQGDAVCTGCSQPLTRVGPRRDTAIMKLTPVPDGEPLRVPLEPEASLIIGRTSQDLSLKQLLSEGQLRKISREHALLTFANGRVAIEDGGSLNGTTLERWDRGSRQRGAPEALAPHAPETVGPRDRVNVANTLYIERSGRRYPFDLATPRPAIDSVSPPATAMPSEEP